MKRDWDLSEISDGKLYMEQDMAKLGCEECAGCSACCRNMGSSAVLDPYDAFILCSNLSCTFAQLLETKLELGMVDGVILPNLRMAGDEEACGFLNTEGRCSIHMFRPGVCRLFPLGRVYGEEDFQYFIQIHECAKKVRTKVKISKWLGVADVRAYHDFIKEWHFFLKKIQDQAGALQEAGQLKTISMFLLQTFYLAAYEKSRPFYEQFAERMMQAKKVIQV